MKMPTYDRHSTVPAEELLQVIENEINRLLPKGEKKSRVSVNGIPVKMRESLRLETFVRKGLTCACCGLKATFFAIERNLADAARNGPYHLNLWGVKDGEEILFTHDHVLARSAGGKDTIENTQTMCTVCNFEKSLTEQRG
jgi:hypothetical protein